MNSQKLMTKFGAIAGLGAVAGMAPALTVVADAAVKNGTFTGALTQTQFGPIQVKIVVAKGKVTKVTVPTYPKTNPRDQQINSQAIPMLVQEVLTAQSSNIQGIGGASYTSQGFYTSLVSALSKAGLK
jgi:uncharacterized protein with FMN-binding domain